MADELNDWMTAARDADDKAAFALVVENCHHLVRSSVVRDTADAELADEIAQEVMVRAWIKRHQYRPGSSPRAWLLAIARTQVIEHHRRQRRDSRHVHDLVRQELLRHRDQQDDEGLRGVRLAALRVCLDDIHQRHRQLLDLIHGQGLSTDDAAELLGIQAPACRQRLSRVQRQLRKCAEQRLEPPE